MRLFGLFILGFITMLFLAFCATTKSMARRDTMLYNLKYVRLRLYREEGAAQFQAVNRAAIDSCALLLRYELAKAENRPN
jgi:hypothetical protein